MGTTPVLFLFVSDGRQRKVIFQYLFTAFMNHARRGADVGIRKTKQVFLKEVNEPRFLLQQRQQL